MSGAGFQSIDWSRPWFADAVPGASAAARQIAEAGTAVADALNRLAADSVPEEEAVVPRFVAPELLLAGTAYEPFIFDTGTVPTRDNLHDFFNGLVWLSFPQAKRRLNQLQAEAIAAHGVGAVRGPLRDAITLFDENGAVLLAPAPLHAALQARDWQQLFVGLRPLWQQARLVLFGHALLEKLVHPRKPITAHVYQAPVAIESIASLDGWLAQALDPAHLATKPFNPLPVLGVPGWWPENENFCFYDDSLVFRRARPAQATTTGPATRSEHGLKASAPPPIDGL
ncbi:DUF3025 domain-containing protein [Paracidovorax wautersii]|uniref:DUF3025 domain-containing protein n=1 Tax=Paracidovorax wautersii TaxID=1177982 RepID=A0ABU1IAF3_9BURK|nr:DUF3025 domain-containing protein [Paracidovorax wautersii]MDR6214195.1 hypothetical protein [Paracidovorax wautersii]